MAARTGSAVWEGTLREGKGTVKLGSGAYEGPYSFASRFESGTGTNPEELIGAAHAGCFSMALAAGLTKAGFSPNTHCDYGESASGKHRRRLQDHNYRA